MRKKFRFWFYRLWIIDCVGCGSLVVHNRGLCLKCEDEILRSYLSTTDQAQMLERSEFRYRFLFRWVPGASDILSNYVYLLKSSFAEPLWHELARYFFIQNERLKNSSLILIPVPSRKNRRHSMYFAQALAEQSGGKVLPLLKFDQAGTIEQKAKNKQQRTQVRFVLNEEFTEQLRSNQILVIVDDVITTGASFEAAYNVLKTLKVCPENIELWAAFRREVVSINLE